MSGETWSDIAAESDAWIEVADGLNGYVAPAYMVARYVSGTSGVTWSDSSDATTTWTAV